MRRDYETNSTSSRSHGSTSRTRKKLYDERAKGLHYAAKSLGALDEQEQLTLLGEAEIAYQNAVYLVEQSGTLPESPIAQKLHQLGAFLEKNETLQQGN